jgi:lysyl-tRNA synthetase class 2
MMRIVEELFEYVARKVVGTTEINFQGQDISLVAPWPRITMAQAVRDHTGVDFYTWTSDEDARKCLDERKVYYDKGATAGHCLAALFDEYVEDKMVQPTFVIDYPVEISPLAKRKSDDPRMTERFEFFIAGHEYGNAFSELNDPVDQRERFVKQVEERRKLGGNNAEVDEDFINALEYGLPPTGGLGIGVDRMIMMLTDSASIRDVLLFPTMKPLG